MKAKTLVLISIFFGIFGILYLARKEYLVASLILAGVFIYDTVLFLLSLKKGIHNAIFFEDIRLEDDYYKQRYKIESLYKDLSHSQEWLQGFALGAEFFIDNYLSDETIGPTELMFWVFSKTQTASITGKDGHQFTDEAYRTYMILSLMKKNNITEEEYDTIAKMMTKETVKETLAKVVYSPLAIEMDMKESRRVLTKED